jgi:hypothetical protein
MGGGGRQLKVQVTAQAAAEAEAAVTASGRGRGRGWEEVRLVWAPRRSLWLRSTLVAALAPLET